MAHLIFLVKVSLELPQHCLRKPKPQGKQIGEYAAASAAAGAAAAAAAAAVVGRERRTITYLYSSADVRMPSFVVEEPVMLLPAP